MITLVNEHRSEVVSLIKKASYRHSEYQIFSDFMELSTLAFSNALDKQHYDEREARYMDIIKNYTKDEADLFPKMLGALTSALEKEPSDILGSIYGELELNSKALKQFFTPDCVSRLMASMSLTGIENVINQKGYITVMEPAVGAGSTIIALAGEMSELGYNYQTQMLVTAIDIDIKAVYQAYLQFSLLGIPAIVIHGDSLSMRYYSYWYTPMYFINEWPMRLSISKMRDLITSMNEGVNAAVDGACVEPESGVMKDEVAILSPADFDASIMDMEFVISERHTNAFSEDDFQLIPMSRKSDAMQLSFLDRL